MTDTTLTRRRVLGSLGAAGAVGLAGCGGGSTDDGASGTVTIRMLQPVSGALQPYGAQALAGFYTGFGYKGEADAIPGPDGLADDPTVEVGDVTYELLVRDTGGRTPRRARWPRT